MLYSQDKIIGVWLGEAAIDHREENPFFYNLLSVLNISENNMATVSNRQNLTYFTWSAVKDYYQFKHDSLQTPLKAKIINHKLIVTPNDSSDFVFIKIKKTFKDKDYKKKTLANTIWSTKESDSIHKTYRFLDSSKVLIKTNFDDFHIIDFGEWSYFEEYGLAFLKIINHSNMQEYILKFDSIGNNAYSGFTFFNQGGAYPVKHNLTLIKKEFPSSKKIDSIKQRIIGNWISTNDFRKSENFDFILFDKDIEYPKIRIEFQSNSFKMIYTGKHTLFENNLTKQFTGTWRISKTGDFIELNTLKEYSDKFGNIEIKDSKFQEIIPFKFLINGGLKLLKTMVPLSNKHPTNETFKNLLFLEKQQ